MYVQNVSQSTASRITILVNGSQVIFDQPPVIQSGRTLAPMRAILEAMDAAVEWLEAGKTVTVQFK